jgi:Transmembrane protein 43
MANTYTEVKETGLLKNIGNAIKSVVIGLILFLLSFVVLWWNEGRSDMSKIAALSEVAPANQLSSSLEGKFISVTGILDSKEQIGDPDYIKPGLYIMLSRKAEMYAWVQTSETKTEKKVGGKTVETTTYNYSKKWIDKPEDSSSFKVPEGHENPAMTINSEIWTASQAAVGAYPFSPAEAGIPSGNPVHLTAEMLTFPEKSTVANTIRREGDYLFKGQGTIANPVVGDIRLSYTALQGGKQATLFGALSNGQVSAYVHKGKDHLYRVLLGTRDEAIATMHSEYTTSVWILRIVGFLMMWIGLSALFAPIHAVLDILPFLGSTSRALLGIVLFPIALVLSLLTIFISIIVHSVIALIICFIIFAGGIIAYLMTRKKRAPAAG